MLKRDKHFILVIAFLLMSSSLFKGQKGYRMEFGVLTGISNYLGELGGRSTKARPWLLDLKMAKTRWNEGIYMRYRFHAMMSVKLALNYLRIEGDDKLSIYAPRRYRNLSFRNDIYAFETTLNFMLYDSKMPVGVYSRTSVYFSAYAFVGAGVFHHNPKTKYQGEWVALQPLETEGHHYSKYGFCVPVGLGFYVTLNKRRRSHRIGLEVNWRYTRTDYLDDISTTYKSREELNTSLAYDLSNRNDELTKQPVGYDKNYGWQGYKTDANGNPLLDADGKQIPANQAPRGNPKNLDSYISLNITYGIAIKSRFTRSRGRRIRTVSF